MYQEDDTNIIVQVAYLDETFWMTQKALAELFGIDRTGIGIHLNNIFNEGELSQEKVCAKFALTTQHGAIEGNY